MSRNTLTRSTMTRGTMTRSPEHSLAADVRRWFTRRADEPCLSCGDVTWTWREFGERSSRLGQGLQGAGIRAGDRVSYLGQNRPEYFEMLVGALMTGAVVASVNWRLAPREMVQVLNLTKSSFLLVDADFLPAVDGFRDQVPSLRKVVVLGEAPEALLREGDETYEEWLRAQPAEDPRVAVAPDDPALMMYTSGTTGLPKAVVFGHAAFGANLDMAPVIGVDADSTTLVAMPVFHSTGTSFGLLTLAAGAHLVVAPDPKPEALFAELARWRITQTMLVPAVLRMMVETPPEARQPLPDLRTVLYAGSPISPELLQACLRTLDCGMVQLYGMTETQSATALLPDAHVDPERPWLLESAGRPILDSRVRIVDPSGALLPDGEVGEVELWARTAMTGYWDDPEATAAVFTADGYLRTGDAGFLRDGHLFLRDRIKDMVVTGGENVYPVEVENALLEHPGIVDAAVIGIPSEKWGESVAAVLVTEPDASLTAEEVLGHCRERLAGYKCPRHVEFVDALPRNPSGKILKRVLREPHWGDRRRSIN